MTARSPDLFLRSIRLLEERVESWDEHPFSLPFVRFLDLRFASPVTFFVGENGSGKSTLVEALAVTAGTPAEGGGRVDTASRRRLRERLSPALRTVFGRKPKDAYFFRADTLDAFADLLEEREQDIDFKGDPYQTYGGTSLHQRSHGEAFLAVLTNRLKHGLILMDEPESALSPQRQLALLARIHEMVSAGDSQFIVATHSPLLLTFPGADIISFDDPRLPRIELESTSHYQITRDVLNAPERFWRHLRNPDATS